MNQLPKETKNKIRTVAVTGWSRYDHFATLCELLPSALPCLAMCLATLKEGYFDDEIHKAVSQNLGYLRPIQLEYKPFMQLDNSCGNFPGLLRSFLKRQHTKALYKLLRVRFVRFCVVHHPFPLPRLSLNTELNFPFLFTHSSQFLAHFFGLT